jgi:hypothetical protein
MMKAKKRFCRMLHIKTRIGRVSGDVRYADPSCEILVYPPLGILKRLRLRERRFSGFQWLRHGLHGHGCKCGVFEPVCAIAL